MRSVPSSITLTTLQEFAEVSLTDIITLFPALNFFITIVYSFFLNLKGVENQKMFVV